MCKKFSETYDRLESALSTAPTKRSLEEEESASSPGKRARTESAPAAGLTEGKGQKEAEKNPGATNDLCVGPE